jgi:DNA-directed RNA polymerase subunit K/omega
VSAEIAQETTAPALTAAQAGGSVFSNRFLFVVVASQRVVQIRNGARPRVDPRGHKPGMVAVAEVLAGCISYTSL